MIGYINGVMMGAAAGAGCILMLLVFAWVDNKSSHSTHKRTSTISENDPWGIPNSYTGEAARISTPMPYVPLELYSCEQAKQNACKGKKGRRKGGGGKK